MKKNFYFMRHAETIFNERRKIQGWCDSPLTKKGIAQAEAARDMIAHLDIDHYYSSTSERCVDTLEIATDYKVEYTRLKGLKERNFGYLEGESEDINPKRDWDFTYDDLFPPYGGETSEEFSNRIVSTIHEIMEKEENQNVLAVSHSGAAYFFMSSVTDPSVILKEGGFTNCCLLHYTYEDGKFEFIEIMRPEVLEK